MPGGTHAGFLRGTPGIVEIARNTAVDENHALAWNALAIEWGAQLLEMKDVVGDSDVFSKDRLAEAAGKAGALILDSRGGEIVEQEADEIEHRGRFEDDGVFAGREFGGIFRAGGFFAGGCREGKRIESTEISGVGFGPTGGGPLPHGDREFRLGLPVSGEESARVREHGLALAAGENPCRDLTLAFGEITGVFHGACAGIGGEGGGGIYETPNRAVHLFAWQGQKAGIFR